MIPKFTIIYTSIYICPNLIKFEHVWYPPGNSDGPGLKLLRILCTDSHGCKLGFIYVDIGNYYFDVVCIYNITLLWISFYIYQEIINIYIHPGICINIICSYKIVFIFLKYYMYLNQSILSMSYFSLFNQIICISGKCCKLTEVHMPIDFILIIFLQNMNKILDYLIWYNVHHLQILLIQLNL